MTRDDSPQDSPAPTADSPLAADSQEPEPPSGGESAEASNPEPLGPAIKNRVLAIDVLRGVAVLGILAMNIYAFAMPFMAYNNPLAWGGTSSASLSVWFFTHIVFDQKFMPVFSMLFGAGLVLMGQRAGNRSIRGLWYRRELWLLVIGAAHAYLLWFGDILFSYAALGMLIYPLRRLAPRTLLITGAIMMMVGMLVASGGGFYAHKMSQEAPLLEAKKERGETLDEAEEKQLEQWLSSRPMMAPTQEDIQHEVEAYSSGSYLQMVAHRAPTTFMMQTVGLLFFGIWRMGALMLWGMALMKLGIFAAERSSSFYLRMALIGYGLGLPLLAVSSWQLSSHNWNPVFMQLQGLHWNYVGSLGIALGHVAMVMLAVRHDVMPALRRRLQAVGQMALSNYLMHSLVCTTLFYSYGFGLYGQLERPMLIPIVLSLWMLQLMLSPWWLARMRFGPAEWLWRSLTYAAPQPLKR